MRGNTLRTSTVQAGTKPNLNEAFFVKRELPPDHPDVLANRRFRGANRWPAGLPGFRETIVDYCDTLERLVLKMVRLYARALDLPADYFDGPFRDCQYSLRMTHYPHQDGPVEDEFGLAPHTDTSFLTLLAPNDVPGLSIRTQSGNWIDAPAIPDAYVVNGGQMLQRWTNDFFLATPHRAINRSGGERYAIPFFCDSNIDWPVAAVPTTVGPDRPPKYPTTYYTDYMVWYQKRNYDVLNTPSASRRVSRDAAIHSRRRPGSLLAGEPGALERTAAELRFALTEIGFYFIVNHGVPEADQRGLPPGRAVPCPAARAQDGRQDRPAQCRLSADARRHVAHVDGADRHPANLNEAFFVARDLANDHPDVLADRRFRSANRWPGDLPGFRETVVAYCDRWSGWCKAGAALRRGARPAARLLRRSRSASSSTSCA